MINRPFGVISTCGEIRSTGETISDNVTSTRNMMEFKVKIGKKDLPTGLSPIQELLRGEKEKITMVSPDLYGDCCVNEEMTPVA